MTNKHIELEVEKIFLRLKAIQYLKKELLERKTFQNKFSWVMNHDKVKKAFEINSKIDFIVKKLGEDDQFIVGLLILADQFEGVMDLAGSKWEKNLVSTICLLRETDRFYASIGGLLGYIEKTLQMFCGIGKVSQGGKFTAPPFLDMREKTEEVWNLIYEGIKRLPELSEVYVVGGAGDRLNLHDETTGEAIPVAYLSFCGRPLLEHLFRDLEAREYLYFKLFGKQLFTPVLLMTSHEKENDNAIFNMVEQFQFFGRERLSIRRVVQPLVPLIASNGLLVFQESMELVGKPGGHGVIWKLASDNGAFAWLKGLGVKGLLVRQINNPLSGLDHTLSALVGHGLSKNKAFGFASCPRRQGFAEGLNVVLLNEKTCEASISNIEYTRFAHLSPEEAKALGQEEIPANTNILFAHIESIEKTLKKSPLPGLTVNAKNECEVYEGHQFRVLPVARLEATMQNIADSMMDKVSSFESESMQQELSTFLQLYERSKLISVTKKAYQPGQDPHETPESCFYDWYLAVYRLLKEQCGYKLPDRQAFEIFLENGPNVLFIYHSALGPIWEMIGQKLRGGIVLSNSELELEIAEIYMENLFLHGSLRIISDSPTGQKDKQGVKRYSKDVGRAFLRNVSIKNEGIKLASASDHVKRHISRAASCTIYLEGASEVVAQDLLIEGDFHLVVPHGKRALLSKGSQGEVKVDLQDCSHASWEYTLQWKKGVFPLMTHELLS